LAKYGVVPAVVLSAVIWLILIFDGFSQYTFDPPYLLFILNLLFITGTGFAIAFISAKSYLNNGAPNILLLGCAVLVSGLAAFFAGWASTSANVNATVFNIGILVSSCLQFSGAIITLKGAEIGWFYNRKVTLALLYAACTLFIVALTMLSVIDLIPSFFDANGPTIGNDISLIVSSSFLSVACAIFIWQYLHSKSKVLYWYSLALAITTAGLFGSLFANQYSGILSWVTRVTQYVGGIYFLMALLALRTMQRENLTLTRKWQEAFAASRKQMAKLFSRMLNGFAYCKIVTNKEGQPIDWIFLDCNEAFGRMLGKEKQEFIGRRAAEVFPGIEQEPGDWIGKFGHVALVCEALNFEEYSPLFKRWFKITSYCPKKGYFVMLSEDVSERKKIEKRLANSEMRYRRLFETSQDGIIARDLEGRMIDCNHAYAKMLGYSKQELKGHSYRQVLPKKWQEHREAVIKEVLEKGKPAMYEREYVRKNGSIFPASVRTWRLTDDKGQVMGVWSTVRDITEQKESQKKLEDYSKQLERLVEERTKELKDAERLAAIGETAGMVGHDIRNPLQSIIAEVYLSKEELKSLPHGEAKSNLEESLSSIENQTIYINKIIADLQDYTRTTVPHFEVTELKPLIQDILLNLKIPENIEQRIVAHSFQQIFVDPHMLQRALANIVLNAVQAMPKGGELTITAKAENKNVTIAVRDTGEGIPEETKKNLFKPLFTTKPKGQGFGLAVAKKLIEALGGTITFESEVGKGTTFTMTLPQKEEKA
jgi:PAS domain S-box-containing protein